MSESIFNYLCNSFFINYSLLMFFLFTGPVAVCFLTEIIEQVKSIKIYNNFKEDRQQLMKDQKEKIGVYCLINLINSKIYIYWWFF